MEIPEEEEEVELPMPSLRRKDTPAPEVLAENAVKAVKLIHNNTIEEDDEEYDITPEPDKP